MIYLPTIDENDPIFPSTDLALEDPDGLLAIGGCLNKVTLLRAYRLGIFPWFEEGRPILWWCPSERAVLYPGAEHVSRSMKKLLKQRNYTVTSNLKFEEVIRRCAAPRRSSQGTWITPDMQKAYCELYEQGFAHSVECWRENKLVGGLYGVQVGSVFCGESMFSAEKNASKLAFIALSQTLKQSGFTLIDCQLENSHLLSLGVGMVPRRIFLQKLEFGVGQDIHWPRSEKFQQYLTALHDERHHT